MKSVSRLIHTLALAFMLTPLVHAGPILTDPPSFRLKPPPIEVTEADFAFLYRGRTGTINVVQSNVVPGRLGVVFGWAITLKVHSNKKYIVWREEFELQKAPATWGDGEAAGTFKVSPDRKIAVTEGFLLAGDQILSHYWMFIPNGPAGACAIRVYVDGTLLQEFRFRIIEFPEELDPAWKKKHPSI